MKVWQMGDLRLLGFYIHEDDGFSSVKKLIEQEMGVRERTVDDLPGRVPDPDFIKAVADFGSDYKEFGKELLERAKQGKAVDPKDVTTLDRAERLFAWPRSMPEKTCSFTQDSP